jgi:hypothetical protein
MLLGIVGLHALRRVGARTIGAIALVIVIVVPVAALAVPFTFANGTIADANQVNANFAAVNVTNANVSLSSFQDLPSTVGSTSKFVESTVDLTTTATQRITGVATASFFVTGVGGTVFVGLCYRAAGTTNLPTNFAGTGFDPSARTVVANSGFGSGTAVNTVVPGAGTWQVGMCLLNQTQTVLHVNGMTGVFQVTAQ